MKARVVAILREIRDVVAQTLLIILVLWTIGAGLGVVAIGYCMVAHCG